MWLEVSQFLASFGGAFLGGRYWMTLHEERLHVRSRPESSRFNRGSALWSFMARHSRVQAVDSGLQGGGIPSQDCGRGDEAGAFQSQSSKRHAAQFGSGVNMTLTEMKSDHSGQADNCQLTQAVRELQHEIKMLESRLAYLQSLVTAMVPNARVEDHQG